MQQYKRKAQRVLCLDMLEWDFGILFAFCVEWKIDSVLFSSP